MKRHPIDPFSLVAGLFVTGVAVVALTAPWSLSIGAWVWPTALIATGLAVLVAVLAGSRSRGGSLDPVTADGELDPERAEALSAAYAELDDDMSLDEPDDA